MWRHLRQAAKYMRAAEFDGEANRLAAEDLEPLPRTNERDLGGAPQDRAEAAGSSGSRHQPSHNLEELWNAHGFSEDFGVFKFAPG